jgi:hypothetical protein
MRLQETTVKPCILLEKISNHNQGEYEAVTLQPCCPLSKHRMAAQQSVLYIHDGALSQPVTQTKTAVPVFFDHYNKSESKMARDIIQEMITTQP